MRPLEALLLGVLAVTCVLRGFQRPSLTVWLTRLTFLLLLLLIAHALIEKWRWQLLPAYAGVAFLLLIELSQVLNNTLSFTWNMVCAALLLTATLASATLAYFIPVFTLPAPQGPYKVGTLTSYLVDHRRREANDLQLGRPRELMVQVWYPAQNARGSRAIYRDSGVNSFKSSHLRLVKTHAYLGLPMTQQPDKLPVLIFSPSSGGNRNQNTFQVEDLASHGYVVAAIDHPYSSSRVVFPDGRIVHSLRDAWLDLSTPDHLQSSTIHVEAMVRDQVEDVSFVLDELQRWSRSDTFFRGRLDLGRVGIFGHSFGGAIAAESCIQDPRIRAAINMDGWIFGEAARSGVSKPYLVMNEDAPPAQFPADRSNLEAMATALASRAQEISFRNSLDRFGGASLTIRKACHSNFADFSLFTRIPQIYGECGDPQRIHKIVNEFTLAFFDHYLNAQPRTILEDGGFPGEVRYEMRQTRTTTLP